MGLPKDQKKFDTNHTFPSERPYFDETGSTLANGKVIDPSKSGKDYGIKDPAKTIDIPLGQNENGGAA